MIENNQYDGSHCPHSSSALRTLHFALARCELHKKTQKRRPQTTPTRSRNILTTNVQQIPVRTVPVVPGTQVPVPGTYLLH